jgi:hypothetical protein
MKRLWDFGYFVRALRSRMRHGELSRAPLEVLRVEVRRETAECDWLARPPDPWDDALPLRLREQLSSDQALRDAIEVAQVVFEILPDVSEARLRAFRESVREGFQPIITGELFREACPPTRVSSLVMRAKLQGFRFWMDEGVLVPLDSDHETGKSLQMVRE